MFLAQKMVLLHDMRSIETLARVDVLCVDKTGTITSNEMSVTETFLAEGDDDAESRALLTRYIHTVDDAATNLLAEDLTNVLHTYRLLHLRRKKREYEEALKSERGEEELESLLAVIRNLNGTIAMIEKQLGVTYR